MSKISGVFLSLAAFSLLACSVHSAQAQDIKTIIAKTNAIYKNFKTIQATYETNMSAGPKGSATTRIVAKIINGKKTYIDINPVGQGVGELGKYTSGAQLRIVDDGLNAYMYQPTRNQYLKQNHSPVIFQNVMGANGLPYSGMDPSKQYKLLAPTTLDGSKVYVLEFTPVPVGSDGKPLPPSSGVPKTSTLIDIYIDQATYHIKQTKVTRSNGTSTGTMTTVVKTEILNAPIADTVFAFTPPKGSKQIQLPTRQQGAPGTPQR